MDEARDEVVQLRALVDAQAAALRGLQQRLDALESRAGSPTATASAGGGELLDDADTDEPLARRQMLRGAAVAAGALGAGAVGMIAGAPPAAAASGTFDGNPAVTGTGIGGFGIFGTTDQVGGAAIYGSATTAAASGVSGYSSQYVAVFGSTPSTSPGVRGENTSSGTGVYGSSNTGSGVYGYSDSSIGVVGQGTTGVVAFGPTGFSTNPTERHLHLEPGVQDPHVNTVTYARGDVVADTNGVLWFCVASGQPGTWRRLSAPDAAGALTLLPAPVRIYDSRPGQNPLAVGPKTPLANNTDRTVNAVFGGAGIPAGSTGVLMNLAVTNTNGGGFLGAYSNAVSWPGNASINWGLPNSTVNALCVSAVDSSGNFALRCGGSTDVIVDVVGYYR